MWAPLMSRFDAGWCLRQPTITDLVYEAVKRQAYENNPDAVLNIETHLFDVILCADSCEYELDVGHELHLNVGRWSRLIKEYLPLSPWLRFRDQAVEILSGNARKGATANMMFRDPDRYAKKHRWGGCLMGASFRMGPEGFAGTLTFYSRTTYIGYMGILDAAIASIMAREIRKAVGPQTVESDFQNMRFQWHIASMQLHSFKSLPYIYRKPDLNRYLEKLVRNPKLAAKAAPFWKHASKWQRNIVEGWERDGEKSMTTQKYGPLKRVIRRWAECQGYLKKTPPSLLVSDLTFEKAL